MNLTPATKPTFYFIGVTTAQSSIMKLFPLWADYLGLDAEMKGIDIELNATPETYRQVVNFLKQDELSLGALVTTHKIDLYNAAKDLFDELDFYAETFGELSSISKQNGRLIGHAKDHISSGLTMQNFIEENYWKKRRGDVFVMGAGGSGIAITSNLVETINEVNRPSKVYVTDRGQERLDSMKSIIKKVAPDVDIEYKQVNDTLENDAILSKLKPYSLIINATGLGKDRPGSPLTNNATFPENSLIWELNYRGDLQFMYHAQSQQAERNLHVEDGWIYFLHGWTQVISEVFHIELTDEQFDAIDCISSEFNKQKTPSK